MPVLSERQRLERDLVTKRKEMDAELHAAMTAASDAIREASLEKARRHAAEAQVIDSRLTALASDGANQVSITIRLTADLKTRFERLADHEDRAVAGILRSMMRERIERYEAEMEKKTRAY